MKKNKNKIMQKEIENIKKYKRLSDYLSAAQIYLKDNFLLEKKLEWKHIKSKLLWHWGTVPGQNFIYANINNLICKTWAECLYISGPWHWFPAVQSNLFIEWTLSKIYWEQIPYNKDWISEIIWKFSWPYGYPSHLNPWAPWAILEGGELWYSLSTAFWAVFDNPNLIATCVIWDWEAETATINAAWHSLKFLNPKESWAVLPFVHLNWYKISWPTLYSMMSEEDLKNYFLWMWWEALIVEWKWDEIYEKMVEVMDYSYKKIKEIQNSYRSWWQKIQNWEKWPVIILKTPKWWGTVKEFKWEKLEWNCKSHQVVLWNCKKENEELELIEKWLKSYKVWELIDENWIPNSEIKKLIPEWNLKMWLNKHTYWGEIKKDLILPKIENQKIIWESSMKTAWEYLNKIFELNKENKNFRLFSPDETYSNKVDAVFKTTSRAFMQEKKSWDIDLEPDWRVMEMLSEHTLQGWLEWYLLTWRHWIFVSYEAFIQIITSMVDQYWKFLKASEEFEFRKPISSLNFILSSTWWRQDHNGFSHQNPWFVSGLLDKHNWFTSAYFPVDANSMTVALDEIFQETNQINVIIAWKREENQWLTIEQAKKSLEKWAMIWDFISDENPDVVISSAWDYITNEAIEWMKIIREYLPEAKLRYTNVCKLTSLWIWTENHSFSDEEFDSLFTKDKEIIFNYHGYANDIKKLIFWHKSSERFSVFWYEENGSTTTPLDMLIRNKVSRYHTAISSLKAISKSRKDLTSKAIILIEKIELKIKNHRKFIIKNWIDPENLNKI